MGIAESVFKEYMALFPDGKARENELMSEHTSFRIGGPARLMLLPETAEQLCAAVGMARRSGMRTLIMGNGTDLLISDEPLDMIVIKTHDGLSGIKLISDDVIEAESGGLMSRMAVFAQSNALSGLEFAHGIPGTVGGGLAMNAGAYGGELKDVLVSVKVVSGTGELLELSAEECDLSYRHSRFSDSDDVIISARFRLVPGDGAEIRGRMDELMKKRRDSQPLNMPSAGSTFKRPAGGYAAAMIDEAGLRGYTVGGAQVSEKHAGFVVNRGGASFDDVARLMEHIQRTVYDRTGTKLEPEVKIIR